MQFFIAIILLIIGYFVGVFIPFNLRPEIVPKPVSSGEFYYYSVTTIGVIATSLTVIIALFKEDINRLFKKVKIEFSFLRDKKLHEDVEDIKGNKKAKKYYCIYLIKNVGNISADNCELFLEKIIFIGKDKSQTILEESIPVSLAKNKEVLHLPCEGKVSLHLFDFNRPSRNSTPEGKGNILPPRLNILGFTEILAESEGEWVCSYSLHSSSMHKPERFELHIKWNGQWEDRLSEMSNNLIINMN